MSLFSYENLYRHYLGCRRNKRNTINALRFEARQELNLLALSEIFAADFRDRVVHHVLVDHLEQYWERVFIHDSYACRKGKGVHAAVDRLQRCMRQVSANGQRRAWYLQLDIRNYFMRIDKAILWRLLEPHIADADARWLTELLVFHDCAAGHILKGAPGELARVPAHKSLLRCEPGKGLPIGNLNSQFFANVYLNGLDQFVKHRLRCRQYLRYCDDFVLLSDDREQLLRWRGAIEDQLEQTLQLELNPRQRLRPVSDGVDFLGYIVRRDYRLVRRRVVNNLRARLLAFEAELVGEGRLLRRYRFEPMLLDALYAVLCSYRGHLAKADSEGLWASLWTRFAFLSTYLDQDAATGKLVRKDCLPRQLTSARAQYRWLRQTFVGDVLFFQVGRFYELYGADDVLLAQRLGLQPLAENRRGAHFGFPVPLARRYARILLRDGRAILVATQTDNTWTGIRERRPLWRLVPRREVRLGAAPSGEGSTPENRHWQ
ncbi:hypothetical protein F2Q65_18490 [Thiohalocapsa marina]|uniref:Reverse transcriptase domain-containing protein n=1 Tax=Thiohalocapsa marina TaxID=424902 RepID=A0A5M8FB62_9GAMM|nr:reverse transcriptase domain-containing protein [Thiohalocapsa marina]KAA6182098.1 hypothetical protein F2Q65_18465 [Thiohalocapsa marina]KAA6182103.1 hypothetical protein F2Q65_18490 [Thiohalocapsa marina]